MKQLKQFYKDPGFFPFHWLGWKWGERPFGPMWWAFSFLLCYLTGVAQQSWLFHEQTRLVYYPAVYLGLKGPDCNSISLHDAFIWPSPSPYLEAKTFFLVVGLLDKEIRERDNRSKNNRIFSREAYIETLSFPCVFKKNNGIYFFLSGVMLWHT